MRRPLPRLVVPLAAFAVLTLGCEAEEDPITPDPEGLQEPAESPEGAPEDGLGDTSPETGEGDPAVEGDTEGQFDPESQDDE